MTQADLGVADAYINGDFSFKDKEEGLLNLFLVSFLIIFILISSQCCLYIPAIAYSTLSCQLLLQVLIANKDTNSSIAKLKKTR